MSKIIAFGRTQVDSFVLNGAFKDIMGFSFSQSPIENTRDYYNACNQERINPLNHISYSILILSTKEVFWNFMAHEYSVRLDIVKTTFADGYIALTHGTLKEWRETIINLSNSDISDIRYLANLLHGFFLGEGLQRMFSDYYRKEMFDETYKLLEHK